MAIGQSTFSDFGGAVSDLFAAQGYRYKAQGEEFEQKNYRLAATFADQNETYAMWSAGIKEMQADREEYKSLGATGAAVAGAGFAASGSALDILRDSAAQGALQKATLQEQGLIQTEGYKEQAQSYRNMADAAGVAIEADKTAATGAMWSAGFKAAAGVATLFA